LRAQARGGGRRRSRLAARPAWTWPGRQDRDLRRPVAARRGERTRQGSRMIRSLVRLALDQPVGLMFALALFVGVGWNAFRALPEGVHPELAPLSTPIGEIFRYRLSGAGLDPTELRTLEDWVVEKHLRQVPGVAEVVTAGGFVKQYQVTLDLARMKSFDVTLQQ